MINRIARDFITIENRKQQLVLNCCFFKLLFIAHGIYDILAFLYVFRFFAASQNAFSIAGVSSGESSSYTISFFAASSICLICSFVGFWFLSKVTVRIINKYSFLFCWQALLKLGVYSVYVLYKQQIEHHLPFLL